MQHMFLHLIKDIAETEEIQQRAIGWENFECIPCKAEITSKSLQLLEEMAERGGFQEGHLKSLGQQGKSK